MTVPITTRVLLVRYIERAAYLRGRYDRLAGRPIMDHGDEDLRADSDLDELEAGAYLAGYDSWQEIVPVRPGFEAEAAAEVTRLARETGVPPIPKDAPVSLCEAADIMARKGAL